MGEVGTVALSLATPLLQALATLLMQPHSPELTMRINFKVCVDCQAFLAHATQLLGRPISVLEPSRQLVFQNGRCEPCIAGEGGAEDRQQRAETPLKKGGGPGRKKPAPFVTRVS